jgi:orotidine-5'-phosphate decarboxylase
VTRREGRAGDGRERLVYALDYPDLERAESAARAVSGEVGTIKVGLELFVAEGPRAIDLGREARAEVFLDLKLHDIPATVAGAVATARSFEVRYLTVHASGGEAMLRAALEAAEGRLEVVAVTLLTSLAAGDLGAQGIAGGPVDRVRRLAALAFAAGVRAFVCSPLEAAALRSDLGAEARLVTPGIRPAGGERHDQARVATPGDAIAAGADLLVVGRPIRDAADPAAAARSIALEIGAAVAARAAGDRS